jgi:serine protease Do
LNPASLLAPTLLLAGLLWPPQIALATAPDLEELVLAGGRSIVGEIVAEKPQAYFVDLGYDVIRVPRDQVVTRRKPGEGAAGRAVDIAGSGRTAASGLFTTLAEPPRVRPVPELVEEYGSAVLSIETPSGSGSGFFINAAGDAVTNHHVIEGETRLTAIVYVKGPSGWDRRRFDDVSILALNPFLDLALIRVNGLNDLKLRPVILGNGQEINVGDGVFAIGNPLGLERSVSQGIVSTRNRSFDGLVFLQTDAAINPGNSGGPLFNLRGEVVGVTNMRATRGDNVGFAIPVPYVKEFLVNREAFTYDKDNPNTGYRYLDPPRRASRAETASAQPTH